MFRYVGLFTRGRGPQRWESWTAVRGRKVRGGGGAGEVCVGGGAGGSNVKLLAIFRDWDWIKVRLQINVWWRWPNSAARAERSFALEDVCLHADKQTDGESFDIHQQTASALPAGVLKKKWKKKKEKKKSHVQSGKFHPFTHLLSGSISPADPSVNLPSCPGECLCKHNRCSSWISHYSTWHTPADHPLLQMPTQRNKWSYDSVKQRRRGSCSNLVQ